MTTLDKIKLNLDDQVYDLVYGYGSITGLTDTTITVKFSGGRVITYKVGGYINGVRRLYWHNPVIIAPPKNKKFWSRFKLIILDVYNLLLLKD